MCEIFITFVYEISLNFEYYYYTVVQYKSVSIIGQI